MSSVSCFQGVLLAILEMAGVLSPIYVDEGEISIGVGTVAAGYQNFLICIEMFFGAIAMYFAFPHKPYAKNQPTSVSCGGGGSLQSISSNLKETMNPKDIMVDAIHNFHPHYQQYTQHDSQVPKEELEAYYYQEYLARARGANAGHYQEQPLEVPVAAVAPIQPDAANSVVAAADDQNQSAIMPGLTRNKLNEKAVLLTSAEELA